MTMFCGKCGTKRDSRSKYCISCGYEFKTPFKEEDAKKSAKEKPISGIARPTWVRVMIVLGGISGVVLAVLLVFRLATGSFHKKEKVSDTTVAEGGSPLSLVDQAQAKADAGDLDGAIKQLEDFTKNNPNEGVFYWYLADFYKEQGDLEAGIKTLEKCYNCYKDDSFWGAETLKKKEEFRQELLRIKGRGKEAK